MLRRHLPHFNANAAAWTENFPRRPLSELDIEGTGLSGVDGSPMP
jgi:hypothetical protein